jgi:predicted DNA-binding transcriptional regulator AlpA
MDAQDAPDTFIKRREVLRRTVLSNTTMYREIAAGRFPGPVKLARKAAAWSARDVDAWIAERADQARQRRADILGRQRTPTDPTKPAKKDTRT